MRPQRLVWALCIASAYMYPVDSYDPFFIIGHMSNDIKTSKWFLENGANALEIDIQFNASGYPTRIFHGVPCDCLRSCTEQSNIKDFMNEIRNLASVDGATYYGKLLFLMLDLKPSKLPEGYYGNAGYYLGQILVRSLWHRVSSTTAVAVILSIPHTEYVDIFEGARTAILRYIKWWPFDHLGYAIDSFSEGADAVANAFRNVTVRNHRWIGTGITNCLPYWAETEQTNLLSCRHVHFRRCGVVDKAFHWTVDTQSSIREAMRRGYDAVITNYPEDAVAVARELGVRMANRRSIWASC